MVHIEIKQEGEHLYSMILPRCNSSTISKIADPTLPYVWVFDYRSERMRASVEGFLTAMHTQTFESIVLRQLEVDLCLSTKAFLGSLPDLSADGLDAIQAHRPLPQSFRLDAIKAKRGGAFHQLGILFYLHLPHPHEDALLVSPSRTFLEQLIARVFPVEHPDTLTH